MTGFTEDEFKEGVARDAGQQKDVGDGDLLLIPEATVDDRESWTGLRSVFLLIS